MQRIAFSCTWFKFYSSCFQLFSLPSLRSRYTATLSSTCFLIFLSSRIQPGEETDIGKQSLNLSLNLSLSFVWAKYKLMKLYERSLQALLSSAPRGFAARLHVLARLASLTQIGELARRLDLCLISHHLHWSISGVDFCVFLV